MKRKVAQGEFGRRRRVLVVSDVRGRPDLLRRLLQKLDYRPGRDGLVLMGDLFGKGPDGLGALHMAMELMREDHVFVLRGGCEAGLPEEGGAAALERPAPAQPQGAQSEAGGFLWQPAAAQRMSRDEGLAGLPAAVQHLRQAYPAEAAFLKALPDILDTEDYRFAHGGLSDAPSSEQGRLETLPLDNALPAAPESEKLLVAGRDPVCRYTVAGRDVLSFAPFYSAEKNILVIDGAMGIQEGGQLNGVELWEGAYRRYSCEDGLGRATVLKSCKHAGTCIAWVWPDWEVEVLEQNDAERTALCRHKATGQTAQVPLDMLEQGLQGTRLTGNYTNLRLPAKSGDRVRVVRRCGAQTLVKKDSVLGWMSTDNLIFAEEDIQ